MSTQARDAGTKQTTNVHSGVRQDLGYAPLSRRMAGMGGHLLAGEALRDGQWEALLRLGRERMWSEALGEELQVREREPGGGLRELRFFDPIAGEDLRTL